MLIQSNNYIQNKNWQRIPGSIFMMAGLVYLSWLVMNLNYDNLLISIPFGLVQILTFFIVSISVINNWSSTYRKDRLQKSVTPDVGVVIPTYGEIIQIIEPTVLSLLNSNYEGKIVIVLSNDERSQKKENQLQMLEERINNLLISQNYKGERVFYLRHSSPHDQAKAGNLNQAMEYIKERHPEIELLITEDADEIAYADFVDAVVGYFENPQVAYVQTIKQSLTHPSDPFGNQDLMFYCRTAASRDACNSMFSCGSGVMWRIRALEDVGGFNTWNLVEDLTTSYEMLSRGWESRFHYEPMSEGLAPEDLPNYIKQRGTWAIDTMRIFFWNNPLWKKGLTWRQKLQFLEPCLFYINGFVTTSMIIVASLSLLFEAWPTTANAWEHGLMMLPYFLAMETYFLILAGNIPYYRVRQMWVGLAPVFVKATIIALMYGPNKKPKYKVTRKQNQYSNYLYMVWPQIGLLGLLVAGLGKTILTTPLYSAFDWGAVFWSLYLASFLVQIIKISYWGWQPIYQLNVSILDQNVLGRIKNGLTSAIKEALPIQISKD